jgi:glutamine amidotransferase
MTVIVDYGVGNLFSLRSSLESLGATVKVSGEKEDLIAADRIVLPGVGAFGDAAQKLKDSGLVETLVSEAKKGKPLLGICLGMQLLFEKSYEYGEHDGLGLIGGEIRPIADVIPAELKIPHIGWNALNFTENQTPLFRYIQNGDFVYFVHSFYATGCEENTVANAEYGAPLTAAVARGKVYGCQFHPEKSGKVGLSILRAFCEI